jgi:transcriptional regulator with XRE-family HTH domain
MKSSNSPIRRFRQTRRPPLSLDALANQLGISVSSLSRIELGNQVITNDLLVKLCAMGMNAEDLRPDLAKLFRRKRRRSLAA